MTNEEVQELHSKVAKGLAKSREATKKLREANDGIDHDPLIRRRWSPEGKRDAKAEKRQEAREAVKPHVEQARAAREAVRGFVANTRANFLHNARHVPLPAKLPIYVLEGETLMLTTLTRLADDMAALRLTAELKNADSEDLVSMARRAVAGGTESDAARLRTIQQELRTRDDAVARAQVADLVQQLSIPEADAVAVKLAEQIESMAACVEEAYHEIETPDYRDVSPSVEAIRANPEGFVKGLPAAAAQHAEAARAAGARLARTAVLEELEGEIERAEIRGTPKGG